MEFLPLLYLLASNLASLGFLILIIGVSNGLFNVGYTNLILNLSEQSDREWTFLLARIVSQVSLVMSTVLATLVSLDHISVMIFLLIVLSLVLAFLFKESRDEHKAL